jgi:hypothetical protein
MAIKATSIQDADICRTTTCCVGFFYYQGGDFVDLDQLRFIKNEIELIKSQIDKLENQVVTDVVSGSSAHYPYGQRKFVITGIGQCDKGLVNKLKARLENHLAKLLTMQNEMMTFIESVEDSELRQILILRYVCNQPWREVAQEMNYAAESVPRKRCARFFASIENDRKSRSKVC